MVFFVLSGFFISSSVMKDFQTRRWSWERYLANRGIRLYVVLVPALLLTLFWDQMGVWLPGGSAIYSGQAQPFLVPDVAPRSGLLVLVGNALFLQNIWFPTLGTNGPLWSLSNEFWYYLLFPLLYLVGVRASTALSRCVSLVLIAIIAVAGWRVLPLFPVWLLGPAVARMPSWQVLYRPGIRRLALAGTGLALVGGFVLARMECLHSTILADYVLGLLFAAFMYVILHEAAGTPDGLYAFVAGRLAGMSYTLYLVHLPVMVFLFALFGLTERWLPDSYHLSLAAGLCTLVFLYAFLLSRLTEARTDWIRQVFFDRVKGKTRLGCVRVG